MLESSETQYLVRKISSNKYEVSVGKARQYIAFKDKMKVGLFTADIIERGKRLLV